MSLQSLRVAVAIALSAAIAVPNTPSSASPTCDRQLVMRVDSGKVSMETDGFQIDVFGVSESAGWSNATLVVVNQSDDSATLDFVACRPQVSAQVLTPIQARVVLDLGFGIRKLTIRARTNAMEMPISQ